VKQLFGKGSPVAPTGKATPGKQAAGFGKQVDPFAAGLQPTTTRGLSCITGLVQIFAFVQPPTAGAQVGTITPVAGGNAIPLIQTRPTPFGGISLAAVNNQVTTVCGVFTQTRPGVQIALDVRVVRPAAPPTAPLPTPIPFTQQLIQLLILLLLIQSGLLPGVTLASAGLTGLAGVDAAGLLRQAGVLA